MMRVNVNLKLHQVSILMSDVRCQKSYVKCQKSNVKCQMSYVKCQMSHSFHSFSSFLLFSVAPMTMSHGIIVHYNQNSFADTTHLAKLLPYKLYISERKACFVLFCFFKFAAFITLSPR